MYLRVLIIQRVNVTVNYSGRNSYQFGTTSGEIITSIVLQESTRSGEYLSLVLRKPVFGVFDQVPHKPGCTAIEDS